MQAPPHPANVANPEETVASDAKAPSRKHIGILVIHGMGEENPYGTIDSFARGLYRYFRYASKNPVYSMKTQWKERGSDPSHVQRAWTQAQIRFEKNSSGETWKFPIPDLLTVAEYYWSPVTKGKIKDLAVLTWLIRVALEPFRYISENLQAMVAANQGGISRAEQTNPRRKLAAREIFRLALIYPLLLGSFLALAGFLSKVGDLATLLKPIGSNPKQMLIGLLLAARLLILASLAVYFLNFAKWQRYREPGSDPARRFNSEFLILATIFVVVLLVVPVWAAGAWHSPALFASGPPHFAGYGWITMVLHKLLPGLDSVWQKVTTWPVWIRQIWQWSLAYFGKIFLLVPPFSSTTITIPLAEFGIAAVIRNFLINYLGDVAIYTNLNQRSANFSIRSQILEECGNALTSLYADMCAEDDQDFELVVAAHSLGTVIAYDTINDLFNRARIGVVASGAESEPGKPAHPPAQDICNHLRGLLTFGSPLNKTYYFFRDESEAQELIRAQIVDDLHVFRQAAPCRNLQGAPLTSVPIPPALQRRMDAFRWINVWSHADIFSGELFFYTATDQLKRPYHVPILAHVFYWNDSAMYSYFAKNLLS
jgi:hypothetical protein